MPEKRNRAGRILKRLLPEPFLPLVAIATVTSLLMANPGEGVRLVNLVDPLVVALAVALLAWLGTFVSRRSRATRSLIATAVAFPLLLSGYIFSWLRDSGLELSVKAGAEIGLVLAVMAVGGVVARRWGCGPDTSRFLNLFSALVVLMAIPAVIRSATDAPVRLDDPTPLPDTTDLARPDIYLVVLDAYSGEESLRWIYDYDNRPFLDSLASRGFALPSSPRANFTKTFLSLGSMLNRGYFDRLTPPTHDTLDRRAYYTRMEVNRTTLDLKRLGYSFHYVGSSYPPLAINRLADEQFSERESPAFERLYLSMTAADAVSRLCFEMDLCHRPALPFRAETATETEARIDYLLDTVDRPGPKFVYAHWLLPHGPYRFDADCAPREGRWSIGEEAVEDETVLRELYVEQVRCTNRHLLRVVDRIRDASMSEPPVIILQSDHGNGRFPAEAPTRLGAAREDQVRERFDVFAAYVGPAGLGDSLAVHRTPVNLFRTLFRVLWDVPERPLPDRYFWSQGEQALELVEMRDDLTPRSTIE